MKKEIKSHVYIPNSILKKFGYKDDNNAFVIDYIDFSDNKIKTMPTKQYNIGRGYYDNENEQILANEVENKIGNVIKKLEKDLRECGVNAKLTKKEVDVLFKYISYYLIRNDEAIEALNDIKTDLIPFSTKYNIALTAQKNIINKKDPKKLKNELIKNEKDNRLINYALSDMKIVISFNKTNKKVLITNSTKTLKIDKREYSYIALSITPNIFISVVNGNISKERYIIQEISDETTIDGYNNYLYLIARETKPYILAGNKVELKRVLKDNKKLQ